MNVTDKSLLGKKNHIAHHGVARGSEGEGEASTQRHSLWNTPARPEYSGPSEPLWNGSHSQSALSSYYMPSSVLGTCMYYFLLPFQQTQCASPIIINPLLHVGKPRHRECQCGIGEGASIMKHKPRLSALWFQRAGRRWVETRLHMFSIWCARPPSSISVWLLGHPFLLFPNPSPSSPPTQQMHPREGDHCLTGIGSGWCLSYSPSSLGGHGQSGQLLTINSQGHHTVLFCTQEGFLSSS